MQKFYRAWYKFKNKTWANSSQGNSNNMQFLWAHVPQSNSSMIYKSIYKFVTNG